MSFNFSYLLIVFSLFCSLNISSRYNILFAVVHCVQLGLSVIIFIYVYSTQIDPNNLSYFYCRTNFICAILKVQYFARQDLNTMTSITVQRFNKHQKHLFYFNFFYLKFFFYIFIIFFYIQFICATIR